MFGNKDDKAQEKLEKLMKKYELDNIEDKYINAVKNINGEIAGSKLMEVGNLLAPSQTTTNQLLVIHLNAIMQQNWIIIRLLNDIKNKQ